MSSLSTAVRFGLLWFVGVAPPASAALVINEVLYDPAGADGDNEWVEILNTGPSPAPLEGVSLESGDGGGPGRWRIFWEGKAGDWIEPGGLWVVGGAYRGRPPDAEAPCGLQNGPDGVRLRREGWELDRVGWGEHLWAEYFEGSPAPIGGSGKSLARRRDGLDTEDNAADCEAAEPSPGRPNRPEWDLSVAVRTWGRPMPLSPGEASRPVAVTVRNRGLSSVSADSFELFLDGERLLPGVDASDAWLAAGDSVTVEAQVYSHPGEALVRWPGWVEFAADQVEENDADTLCLRAWPPPLRLSEIAPRPDSGRGEWIELRYAGATPTDLAGWALRDAAGTVLRLIEQPPTIPGEILLVARDSLPLPNEVPGVRRLSWKGSWPSLNDRSTGGEAADTLWLLGPEGRIADWAVWANAGVGESWIRATDAGEAQGLEAWIRLRPAEVTPGGPNPAPRLSGGGSGELLVPSGLSLERHPDGVWFRVPASAASRNWSLKVFDLSGREVWRRAGSPHATGEQWLRWDGHDGGGGVRPGVMLVELRQRDRLGAEEVERRTFWVAQ